MQESALGPPATELQRTRYAPNLTGQTQQGVGSAPLSFLDRRVPYTAAGVTSGYDKLRTDRPTSLKPILA